MLFFVRPALLTLLVAVGCTADRSDVTVGAIPRAGTTSKPTPFEEDFPSAAATTDCDAPLMPFPDGAPCGPTVPRCLAGCVDDECFIGCLEQESSACDACVQHESYRCLDTICPEQRAAVDCCASACAAAVGGADVDHCILEECVGLDRALNDCVEARLPSDASCDEFLRTCASG